MMHIVRELNLSTAHMPHSAEGDGLAAMFGSVCASRMVDEFGDEHAYFMFVPDDIEDAQPWLRPIVKLCREQKIERVVFDPDVQPTILFEEFDW